MALRLPRRLNPFSRPTRRELSAREALSLAGPVLRRWPESAFARLCCVYAGALEGEDPAIGPLTTEGRSRLWHFDYFAPQAERFLRIQVCDGATRTEETRIRAGGLDYPQMTFRFAAYGYREDRGREAAPAVIPDTFTDSTVMLDSLRAAWGDDRFGRVARTAGFLALLLPAAYLRVAAQTPSSPPDACGAGFQPASFLDDRAEPPAEARAALIVDDPTTPNTLRILRYSSRTGELLTPT